MKSFAGGACRRQNGLRQAQATGLAVTDGYDLRAMVVTAHGL